MGEGQQKAASPAWDAQGSGAGVGTLRAYDAVKQNKARTNCWGLQSQGAPRLNDAMGYFLNIHLLKTKICKIFVSWL